MTRKLAKQMAHGDWRWRYDGEVAALVKWLADCETVLDLGCGACSPVSMAGCAGLFGVDGFDRSVEQARTSGKYKDVVCADLMTFLAGQPSGSFSAVVALDVIEHYARDEGLELISEMERVSSKRTIIATPNGFLPQPATDNPRQEHLSGWKSGDFRVRGYKVRGMYGLKWLRTQGHELRVPSSRPLAWLSRASGPVAETFPVLAAGLIAIREAQVR